MKDFFTENLDLRLCKALAHQQKTTLMPVQEQVIPMILKGKNLLIEAPTGSGKSLAFLIPLIQKSLISYNKGITAIIVAPTRELTNQLADVASTLLYFCSEELSIIVAGQNHNKGSTDKSLLFGTPLELLKISQSMLQQFTGCLVLDEADLLLAYGYETNICILLNGLSKKTQTVFSSATSSKAVKDLAESLVRDVAYIQVTSKSANIKHKYILTCDLDPKKAALQKKKSAILTVQYVYYLLAISVQFRTKRTILFFNSVEEAIRYRGILSRLGIKDILVLHKSLPRENRENIVLRYKQGDARILICAIDEENVTGSTFADLTKSDIFTSDNIASLNKDSSNNEDKINIENGTDSIQTESVIGIEATATLVNASLIELGNQMIYKNNGYSNNCNVLNYENKIQTVNHRFNFASDSKSSRKVEHIGLPADMDVELFNSTIDSENSEIPDHSSDIDLGWADQSTMPYMCSTSESISGSEDECTKDMKKSSILKKKISHNLKSEKKVADDGVLVNDKLTASKRQIDIGTESKKKRKVQWADLGDSSEEESTDSSDSYLNFSVSDEEEDKKKSSKKPKKNLVNFKLVNLSEEESTESSEDDSEYVELVSDSPSDASNSDLNNSEVDTLSSSDVELNKINEMSDLNKEQDSEDSDVELVATPVQKKVQSIEVRANDTTEYAPHRGLDFHNVALIINVGLPKSMSAYVHRAGRTGRATRDGTVISLIRSEDIEAFLTDYVDPVVEDKITEFPIDYTAISKLEYRVSDAYNRVSSLIVKRELAESMVAIAINDYKKGRCSLNSEDATVLKCRAAAFNSQRDYLARPDQIPSYLLTGADILAPTNGVSRALQIKNIRRRKTH